MPGTQNGSDSPAVAGPNLERKASHGDIAFEVGGDVEDEPARMLVSSAVLSMASRSFAALLGPRFHEGQEDRDPASPAIIRLPHDKSQAMSDMCNLLHLRHVPDLTTCEPERILSLAAIIDKYCCVDALQLACQGLLHDALEDERGQKDSAYTVQIATAAYLLDQQRAFAIATRLMFQHSKTPFSKLRTTNGGKLFPLNALLFLEGRRTLLFERIGTDLSTSVVEKRWCGSCQQEPEMSQAFTAHVMTNFKNGNVWPAPFLTRGINVQVVIDFLEIFEPFEYTVDDCDAGGRCASSVITITEEAKKLAEVACKGLCLRCVKEDCVEVHWICQGIRGQCKPTNFARRPHTGWNQG